jgi:hypothetical protein
MVWKQSIIQPQIQLSRVIILGIVLLMIFQPISYVAASGPTTGNEKGISSGEFAKSNSQAIEQQKGLLPLTIEPTILPELDQRVQINPSEDITLSPGTNYTISVVTGVETSAIYQKSSVTEPKLTVSVSGESTNPHITGIASPRQSYDVQRDDISEDSSSLADDEFTEGSIHRTMVRLQIPESAEKITFSAEVEGANNGQTKDTATRTYTVARPDNRWEEMARLAESRSRTAEDLAEKYNSIFNDRSVEDIVDRGMKQTFIQTSLFVKDIYNLQLSGGIKTKLSGAKSAYTQFSEYHDSYNSEKKFDGPWVGPIIRAENQMLSAGRQQIQRNRVDRAGETDYLLEKLSTLAKKEEQAWKKRNRDRAIHLLKKQYELLTYGNRNDKTLENEDGWLDRGLNIRYEVDEQLRASNYDRNSLVQSSSLFKGIDDYAKKRSSTIKTVALPMAIKPEPKIRLSNRGHVRQQLKSSGEITAIFEVSNNGRGLTSRGAYASIVATDSTLSVKNVEQINSRSDSEVPHVHITTDEKVLTRGGELEQIDGTLIDINEQYQPGETNVYRVTFNRKEPTQDTASISYRAAFQPIIHSGEGQDAFSRYPTDNTNNVRRGEQGWFVKSVYNSYRPAAININIDSINEPIKAGEQLDITASIENVGGTKSVKTYKATIPGIGSDLNQVTVSEGDTKQVSFSIPTEIDDDGSHSLTIKSKDDAVTTTTDISISEPLNGDSRSGDSKFDIIRVIPENLSVPKGNPVVASVQVTNTGRIDDNQSVEFSVDGETVATKAVSIAPGFLDTVSFSNIDVTNFEVGNHKYNISTDNDSAEGNLRITSGGGANTVDPYVPENTVSLSGSKVTVQTDGAEYINISGLPSNVDISNVSEDGGYYQSVNAIVYRDIENSLPDTVSFTLDPDTSQYQAGKDSLNFLLSDRVLADKQKVTMSIIAENLPPKAVFQHTPTRTTTTKIQFDGSQSIDSDGTITNYKWDFDGDGTTDATGSTATNSYQGAGEYDVSLTVTDDDGAVNTTSKVITVEQAADSANFSIEIDTTNSPVTAGQQLSVTTTVENTGEEQDSQETILDVPGIGTDSVSVNLAGGESESVTFTMPTTQDDVGEYTATVTTENDSTPISVAIEDQSDSGQVQLTNVNLTPQSVDPDSRSTHQLSFEAQNISADGSEDEFDITFPDKVELVSYSDVEIDKKSSNVNKVDNTLEFSVDPTGGGSTQISGELNVTVSATN